MRSQIRSLFGAVALALMLLVPGLLAQTANLEELLQQGGAAPTQASPGNPPDPAEPAPVPPPPNPGRFRSPNQNDNRNRWNNPERVLFGRDFELGTNEVASEVFVIKGNATVRGEVTRDLIVMFGNLDLQGVAEQDVVVVMGNVNLGPKSRVLGEIIVVGGELQAHPEAQFQRGVVNIYLGSIVPWLFGAADWVMNGLLWGRLLPHQVMAAWIVAGLFLALYLLLAALFPKPITACTKVLDDRPATAFLSGILAAVFFGPVIALLVASVVGIVAIPFLLIGLVITLLVGKAAVFAYLGGQVSRFGGELLKGSLLTQVLLGGAIVAGLYMIPIIGFVVWGALATFAMGAVLLAASQTLRRERPAPVPMMPVAPPSPGASAQTGLSPGSAPDLAPRSPEPIALRPAGFWMRAMAMALDGLLLIVFPSFALVVFANMDRGFGRLVEHIFPGLFVLGWIGWIAYHILMWTWKGTTIGGMILGLKVVRSDGRPVDFGLAIIRALASFFSAFVLFLGFFWAGWDRNKQSWHDKIAGTVVVRVPFGIPLLFA